jgi:hypothetical protein
MKEWRGDEVGRQGVKARDSIDKNKFLKQIIREDVALFVGRIQTQRLWFELGSEERLFSLRQVARGDQVN